MRIIPTKRLRRGKGEDIAGQGAGPILLAVGGSLNHQIVIWVKAIADHRTVSSLFSRCKSFDWCDFGLRVEC